MCKLKTTRKRSLIDQSNTKFIIYHKKNNVLNININK